MVRNLNSAFAFLVVQMIGLARTDFASAQSCHDPPIITQQPQSLSLCLGDPASFYVAGFSQAGDVISYQWLKDGFPIPGATNQLYSIAAVTVQDVGEYVGYAWTCGGGFFVYSNPASLMAFPGTLQHYGAGTPGSVGCIPQLGSSGCSALGTIFSITVIGAFGGTSGIWVFGVGQASIPVLGGTLLVQPPLFPLPVSLGGPPGLPCTGTATLPLSIPANPNLVGLALNCQALMLDPGAPAGVEMTEGLAMSIGG